MAKYNVDGILESALETITNTLASGDFIRGVKVAGTSVKITAQNLAKWIIESYTGSSLAGSSQSVKAAIDSLNSKLSGITFLKTNVSTETRTFTLENSYRGTLFIYDSSPQRNGIYMVFSTASGVVDTVPISSASDITIDTSVVSKLSLTAQIGSRIIVFLSAQGNVSI